MSPYFKDLAERVSWTAAQAAIAVIAADALNNSLSVSTLQKATVVAIAAAASLLKGVIARKIGNPNTASLIDMEN